VQVVELWRFPVKSFQGEQLDPAEIGPTGIVGDRAYALFDLDTGFGLTARRVPELLLASARLVEDDLVVTLPDGTESTDARVLSDWLGRRVALCRAGTIDAPRYENPLDFERDRDWIVFEGPAGAFHDSRRTQVSLVSTGTLGDWDRRRFRANVVLDGEGEDGWVGSTIALGDARLDVGKRIERCVITTRAQPAGIERDLDVLRSIHHARDGCLAVGALVTTPGRVHVGDVVGVR
jgi:MOSC domain-containing protein